MQKRNIIIPAIAGIVGLAIGVGASGGAPEPEVITEPAPTVTVETAVSTEVVPQVCLDALDDAEEFAEISGNVSDLFTEYVDLSIEIMYAASEWDYDKLDALSLEVDDITSLLDVEAQRAANSTLDENVDACRASSK